MLLQLHAKEEIRKREEEARKEQERQDKFNAAQAAEENRKFSIKARAEEKDRMLAQLYAQRKKEHDIKKVEQEFHLKLRLDKVSVYAPSISYAKTSTRCSAQPTGSSRLTYCAVSTAWPVCPALPVVIHIPIG